MTQPRNSWEMTRDEFIADPPIGYVYDPSLPHEADVHSNKGKITVGDKFFRLPDAARKLVITHELSHRLESALLPHEVISVIDVAQTGIFGKVLPSGVIQGINGAYTPTENLTEAYALIFDDDDFMRLQFPKAREYVVRLAIKKGMPVPAAVLNDYPDLQTETVYLTDDITRGASQLRRVSTKRRHKPQSPKAKRTETQIKGIRE